jgi:hypothetical protein
MDMGKEEEEEVEKREREEKLFEYISENNFH